MLDEVLLEIGLAGQQLSFRDPAERNQLALTSV
jgi:hypothetical protein